MKNQSISPVKKGRAFAILMALASTLLVSSIVLVFFNRATFNRTSAYSSGNIMKADTLALSAMDVITAELIQEIRVDDLNDEVVGSFPNQTFLPLTENIVPNPNADVDRAKAPNLVKVTKVGQPLWEVNSTTQGRDLASGVSTESPSLNRRWVDSTLWESNGLHSAITTDNLEDATADPNNDAKPDWVLVTKGNGIQSLSWDKDTMTDKFNGDYVIGRFAAAIYDVSGLVDLNVAGHLSSLPVADKAELTGSLPALALPNLIAAETSATQALGDAASTDAFISQFRNSATSSIGMTDYLDAVTDKAAQVGWLHAVEGDNMLLSRKDLLRLTKTSKSDWGVGLSNSPVHPDGQYLFTHFSRESNTPSFVYPDTASGNDPVRNINNPNIHNLRMASGGEAADGFKWSAGDPVIPRRFPLSRLSLLKFDATNTDLQSEIGQFFGLYRTSDGNPWTYTGSGPTAVGGLPASEIMTLDEVAAEGREPNFFELLKAAIHNDSLGVTSGWENNSRKGWAVNADVLDGLEDLQILRIGANIIDQADEDSYPTTITYDPAGIVLYAYGIEDLPYIHAIGFRSTPDHRAGTDPGSSGRGLTHHIVPALWNPHQELSTATGNDVPSQIQFYFTGRTRFVLRSGNDWTPDSGTMNDKFHYVNASNPPSRLNEFGLGNFSAAVPNDARNTGSIEINQSVFHTFREPEMINEVSGNSAVNPSGEYQFLDYYRTVAGDSSRAAGLVLKNKVVAEARPPRPVDPSSPNSARDPANLSNAVSPDIPFRFSAVPGAANWAGPIPGTSQVGFNGYFTTTPPANPALTWDHQTYSADGQGYAGVHHFLNPGTSGVGVNAVLRYRDHRGRLRVYNAFAGNVAHPNGNVNTVYDAFGITPHRGGATGLGGHFLWMSGSSTFPGRIVNNPADPTWANSSGHSYSDGGNSWYTENDTWLRNKKSNNQYYTMKADPRTARFGVVANFHGHDLTNPIRRYYRQNFENLVERDNRGHEFNTGVPDSDDASLRVSVSPDGNPDGRTFPGMWASNFNDGAGTQVFDKPSGGGGGRGVARPGDDYYNRLLSGALANPNSLYDPNNRIARPVVLNRPFRSVAELGYVFRDMPMKTLDMVSPDSADAALLDYFSVGGSDDSAMIAGRLNPNTPHPELLTTMIEGAFRTADGTGTPISSTHAETLAEAIQDASTNPMLNMAELVDFLATNTVSGRETGAFPSIKTQREAPLRALGAASNSRTWNLMVDLVAQAGRYTDASGGLSDFLVEGERRYWMHIAIDRYTGKIIDKQIEVAP